MIALSQGTFLGLSPLGALCSGQLIQRWKKKVIVCGAFAIGSPAHLHLPVWTHHLVHSPLLQSCRRVEVLGLQCA
jgi:hypothetical protein